jgi:hypothetical protein
MALPARPEQAVALGAQQHGRTIVRQRALRRTVMTQTGGPAPHSIACAASEGRPAAGMGGWKDRRKEGRKEGSMDAWMDAWMDG